MGSPSGTRGLLLEGDETMALVSWDNALEMLAAWHRDRLPRVGRAVFGFLEVELRLIVPSKVKRALTEEQLDEVLQDVLAKLVAEALSAEVRDLKRYLARTVSNRFIDLERKRKRRPEELLDTMEVGDFEGPSEEGPRGVEALVAEETRAVVRAGLDRLSVEDRVALKLDHAPEWLSEEEVAWLAARAGSSVGEVTRRIAHADEVYALSRIFEPGDDEEGDDEARGRRLGRFLKRRKRAGEKLVKVLGGEKP